MGWCRVVAVILVALGLMLTGCEDEAPLHEQSCTDGRDNDGDGRTDCDDTDCWGTPECPENQCGDNAVGGTEECDGSDLDGYTCEDLGYDGGALDCAEDCTLVVTGCTGDAVCGNGIIDGIELCDGAALGDHTCVDFGYTCGAVTCDASCLYDLTGCEGKLLAECFDYGDLSGGVGGELTCASEVGVMQWDWYAIEVQAGDCDDKAILLVSLLRNFVAAKKVFCAFGTWTFNGVSGGHMWVVMDSGGPQDRIIEATSPSANEKKGAYYLLALFNDVYAFSYPAGIRAFDLVPVREIVPA